MGLCYQTGLEISAMMFFMGPHYRKATCTKKCTVSKKNERIPKLSYR
eukprot:UN06419